MTDAPVAAGPAPGVMTLPAKSRGGFLRHFSRRTSSGGFIPIVDGLRFVAIGLVVLTHVAVFTAFDHGKSTTHLFHVLDQGTFGVNIFFVISGFILALPFAAYRFGQAKALSLRRYYLRRLTRLEPPYMVALFLLAAVLVVVDHQHATALLPHLAAGLAYAHSAIYGEYNPINRVAWTLEIEIQFYLVVPVLTLVFLVRDALRRRALLVGLAAGSIALHRYVLYGISPRFGLTVFAFLAYFLAGFLLADLYLTRWQGMPRAARRWDLVWIVGAPLLLWDLDRGMMSGWLAPTLTFILFVAAFNGVLARRVLTHPVIFTIGGMCYSIYLLHFAVMERVYPYTRNVGLGSSLAANWLVQIFLLTPFVVVICAVYFALVERPCMSPSWPADLRRGLARAFRGTHVRQAVAND
jgi:peptidoglycan/LPS O-acetylase OafA/YrhL